MNPQVAKTYYSDYMPLAALVSWLSRAGKIADYFVGHREFSLTKLSSDKTEKYLRHLCYKTEQQLRAGLRSHVPMKLDIGPVYNMSPRRFTDSGCEIVLRELVFDIDISDYARRPDGESQDCCSDRGTICQRCWLFAVCAVEVLQIVLRQQIGLQNLLWVFSGRRGVHCWCLDDKVARASTETRSTIVDYIKSPMAKTPSALLPCIERFADYHGRRPRGPDEAYEAMWPRIDEPVTRTKNHLLKSPLCVHPATGRVCVPFDPANVHNFRLQDVPTAAAIVAGDADALAALRRATQLLQTSVPQ